VAKHSDEYVADGGTTGDEHGADETKLEELAVKGNMWSSPQLQEYFMWVLWGGARQATSPHIAV